MTRSPPLIVPRPPAGGYVMPRPKHTPVRVLLVEDSPDDADLMTTALHDSDLEMRVTHLEDGESAVAFLRRQGAFADALRPDLILLDLHLPRMNGTDVLKEIKHDPDLLRIPVIVITSADKEKVFVEAYDQHANCCVSKPVDQEEYRLAVKKIEHFWLHVVRRPQG